MVSFNPCVKMLCPGIIHHTAIQTPYMDDPIIMSVKQRVGDLGSESKQTLLHSDTFCSFINWGD